MGEPLRPLDPHDPRHAGPYRLLARLGAGGMGNVYLGRAGGGFVAVKVVHPWLADDDEFRVRFAREVETSRRVEGRWTAAVVDADPSGPMPWLASEYVHGVSLERALRAAGPLPPVAVHVLAADLAAALSTVHAAGLVHRDLKPGNVMFTADRPYLIDFGISRALDATRLTGTGGVLGTPAFMSPEQAAGADLTSASDVFSLGAVLTCAANGTGPFGDGAPLALLHRIRSAEPELGVLQPPVRDLVAACLHRDAGARPGADALAERLVPLPEIPRSGWLPPDVTALVPRLPDPASGSPAPSSSAPVALDAPTVVTRTGRRVSRRGLLIGAGALAVAAGGAGIVIGLAGAFAAPRRTWHTPLGGTVNVLAMGDGFVCAAGDDAQLHRLDLATGERQWTHVLRGRVGESLFLAGGRVLAADGQYSYAVDATSGQLLWESEFTELHQAVGEVVVARRIVDGLLLGLDAASGSTRWTVPVPPDTPPGRFPAVVDGGRVHISVGAALRTLDAQTGEQIWERDTGLPVMLAGPVDGAVVTVPDSGTQVTARDVGTGEPRWRRTVQYQIYDPPVTEAGRISFMAGSVLHCWDAGTGEPRWERDEDSLGDLRLSPSATKLAAAEGTLYVGGDIFDTGRFELYAVDGATGGVRWREPIDNPERVLGGEPVVSRAGMVVLGTESGVVHAVLEE